MGQNPKPVNAIDFLSALPPLYAQSQEGAEPLLQQFLMPFEEMFDGLQAAVAGDALTLTYKSHTPAESDAEPGPAGHPLVVEVFNTGRLAIPKNALVFIPGVPKSTLLAEPIEANGRNLDLIYVSDRNFWRRLTPGDKFVVRTSSGLAGLSAVRETPPPAFRNLGETEKLAYLRYIASWVGLPVRSDKLLSWNRRYLRKAMDLDNDPATLRSTRKGLEALLNAWHREETLAEETVVTDLISPENGVDTVFRIGESRIGLDTMLGEEGGGMFHVHLTADPSDVSMRHPRKIDAMVSAARLMLDMEKPVNTDYILHIKAGAMQIAPDAPIAAYKSAKGRESPYDEGEELAVKDTNTFARIGVTTLLWE